MIELVKVISVAPAGDYRLRVAFTNGDSGVADFGPVVAASGPMVAPLRESTFFARAFVQNGVITWPNGYDIDAIGLHQEMKSAGVLVKGSGVAA